LYYINKELNDIFSNIMTWMFYGRNCAYWFNRYAVFVSQTTQDLTSVHPFYFVKDIYWTLSIT